MSGCCSNVKITEIQSNIINTPEKFVYNVSLVYCKNCGSLKSRSNIQKVK
jgi:hypothetical protein